MRAAGSDPDVYVWWTRVPPALDQAERSACLGLLSEPERQRYARFIIDSAADEYLVAHVLTRTLLSRFANVAPDAWRFRRTEHGRPEIIGADGVAGLRFNLSHSTGVVACAVARGRDVGIDVESFRGGRSMPVDLARRFFARPEVSAIENASPAEQVWLFCAHWTLKEAYLKARGLGLSVRLDWVTFALNQALPILADVHPALGETPDNWEFRLAGLTSRHVLALALGRGELPAVVHFEEIDTGELIRVCKR